MVTEGRKVLVVEDDASMREAIERLLDAAGFECGAYGSAEALLACEARKTAACIVSDLRLPAMSGLDMLAELRSGGLGAPLILITAHDSPGLGGEALRRGAAAFLTKPFRGTALLEAINEVIASGKPH